MLQLLLALTMHAAVVPAAPKCDCGRLWEDRGSLTVSDWIWGPGGKGRAPLPPFAFVKENMGGTNPKIELRDARGARWIVKFGGEVRAETFASRLLYAAGYFAEPIYFVPSGMVSGAHDLKRARPFIDRQGRFHDARFKLRDEHALTYADEFSWSWQDNPFLSSHQLSGLKILIMLTSNWDTKDARDGEGSNTAVFLRRDREPATYIYSFTDWGSSMGRWGGFFKRSKWEPSAYERQSSRFAGRNHKGRIVWGFTGKHTRDITSGITIADVRWLLPYLSRITDAELRAGLVSSGASALSAERLTRSVRSRIRRLEWLAGTSAAEGKEPGE